MSDLQRRISDAKCILFDFDGTLVDSRETLLQGFSHFALMHGVNPTEEIIARFDGLTTFEIVEKARADWKLTVPLADLNKEYFGLLSAGYSQVAECRGASATLLSLINRGVKVGLVTSAAGVLVEPVLRRLSWFELFDHKIFGHPKLPGKPDPALYLLALKSFNISAGDVVVIEDSSAGVRAASAAGLDVVAISDLSRKNDLFSAGAFAVAPHLQTLVM